MSAALSSLKTWLFCMQEQVVSMGRTLLKSASHPARNHPSPNNVALSWSRVPLPLLVMQKPSCLPLSSSLAETGWCPYSLQYVFQVPCTLEDDTFQPQTFRHCPWQPMAESGGELIKAICVPFVKCGNSYRQEQIRLHRRGL